MNPTVLVIPDTNIFLHCKPLDLLPWNQVASESVEVVLVDPVLAELDHWKDQGNDRRAKRVRALLPILRTLVSEGHECVEVHRGPPRISMRLDAATSARSWKDNDSAIIDAALAVQSQAQGHVILLTRDVLLAARCKRRGVSFRLLSAEDSHWNAEPERPDSTALELRKELEELKRQRPVVEVAVDTLGGTVTSDALEIFLPTISASEPIGFVTQWAVNYFEERAAKRGTRNWNLQDYGWQANLHEIDLDLMRALVRRLAGATMCLTVKNVGSVNAEDVRVELLTEGGWLVASKVANLDIEVPFPPVERIRDANEIWTPAPPMFDMSTFHPVDPSEPVWEEREDEADQRGVSRLVVRIPVLRHRDEVDVAFRLGAAKEITTPGKLIIRVSTAYAPKPVISVLTLARSTQEFSLRALIDALIERKELEISLTK